MSQVRITSKRLFKYRKPSLLSIWQVITCFFHLSSLLFFDLGFKSVYLVFSSIVVAHLLTINVCVCVSFYMFNHIWKSVFYQRLWTTGFLSHCLLGEVKEFSFHVRTLCFFPTIIFFYPPDNTTHFSFHVGLRWLINNTKSYIM